MQLFQKKTIGNDRDTLLLPEVMPIIWSRGSSSSSVCFRCKDGSEFGTGFGGLQCPECSEIMSESNSFSSPPWRCSGCHLEKASQDCRDLLDKLELELKEKSEKADNSKESVQEFENVGEFFQTLSKLN